MAELKRIYFASDVHLGMDILDPKAREGRFVAFLKSIPVEKTEALYLLGDIWDFWYEYKHLVPKGFARVLAALEDLTEAGVKVYFFQGNHDIWAYRYFEEIGIQKILKQPYVFEYGGKRFCIGHGDGLGPGFRVYKVMRWVFHNRFFQFLFSLVPSRLAFWIGNSWSRRTRTHRKPYVWKDEREPLYIYCKEFQAKNPVDYFIFGHYHLEVDAPVEGGAQLRVMKDWFEGSYYLYFDGILTTGGSS